MLSCSWSAISRGAVRKGFNVSVEDEIVVNAISKYSYGTAYNTLWDPTRHSKEDKYFCEFELRDRATNQLQWYLKRVSLYAVLDLCRLLVPIILLTVSATFRRTTCKKQNPFSTGGSAFYGRKPTCWN